VAVIQAKTTAKVTYTNPLRNPLIIANSGLYLGVLKISSILFFATHAGIKTMKRSVSDLHQCMLVGWLTAHPPSFDPSRNISCNHSSHSAWSSFIFIAERSKSWRSLPFPSYWLGNIG